MATSRCTGRARRVAILACSLLLALASAAGAGADEAGPPLDQRGVLRRLPLRSGWLEVAGEVVVPDQGWKRLWRLSAAEDLRAGADGGWGGSLFPGQALRVAQRLARDGDAIDLSLQATAPTAVPANEGVRWWLDLPAARWAGGSWRIGERSGELPMQAQAEQQRHLFTGEASRLELIAPGGEARVAIDLPDGASAITLQDGRAWGPAFNLMVGFRPAPGAVPGWSLRLRLAATGSVDASPATVAVGAPTGDIVAGLGGTWCFDADAPTTGLARKLLSSGWARTEIDLSTLPEPAPGAVPAGWAPAAVAALDGAGPEARHLDLTGGFAARGVAVMASIWRLPAWMLEPPLKESGNRIRAERWPWLEAAVVAWLRRAREHGGEPASFSFNEPDYGVRIGFDPGQHRDAIVRLGAAFAAAGLKTRLAAGDVTNPRTTLAYVQPALDDPAARALLDCVAVHSWGGASPAQWAAWRALATRAGLPLIVSEVGPDSDAWRADGFRSRGYQPKEALHLIEVLRDARPQALLRWEFTGDYDLLDGGRPTMRWSTWRWALEALPPGAVHRACASDQPAVVAAAASLPGGGATLLLANAGWGRRVRVAGLPNGAYRIGVATPERPWLRGSDLAVAGAAEVELPADGMVVLTTGALAERWDAPASR